MAAGAWVMVNATRTDILSGAYNIETGTFKMALYPTGSDLAITKTVYSGVSGEHANQSGSGYLTGGKAVALSLTGDTNVKVDIDTDPVWTATGADIAAKWAMIYETGTGKILCFCLLDSGGATITATVGNTFTVAAHTNGVFTFA